ncbi:hypothetical protein RND81_01G036000 [Saponaria officinalis]|uniref:DUF7811 domain-containing protein n=1 Tax=Saponaria officinalis TaxID=3572 RepID=A0AAW1N5I3_SAPOF
MAETSALRFTSYGGPSFPSIPSHKPSSLPSSSAAFLRRPLRLAAKSSSDSSGGYLFGHGGDDDSSIFGDYPWQQHLHSSIDNSSIQWVREDKITLFTSDGLVQLGGSLSPKRITPSEKQQGKAAFQKSQRFQESNYMDPKQSLCLGALFDIAATNGLDMGRRLCIIGFCRSIEMLSDVVEDTVLEHGGEVVVAEKASESGLQEKLSMTVAVPYLWGVPPASETLHLAVRSGGGIIQKMFWQWHFL